MSNPQENPHDPSAAIRELATRHGVSTEAARHVVEAMREGSGRQAQFDHPELGGMGQWSEGGMIMVGRMGDHDLKARVAALCDDAAALVRSGRTESAGGGSGQRGGGLSRLSPGGGGTLFAAGRGTGERWWPDALGEPASAGAQNAMRYAIFPDKGRLVVEVDGRQRIFETGAHRITGVSQAQSGGRSLTFRSQRGPVGLDDLEEIDGGSADEADATPRDAEPYRGGRGAGAEDDVLATIERLADLAARDIISREEFEAKKAELLARL